MNTRMEINTVGARVIYMKLPSVQREGKVS